MPFIRILAAAAFVGLGLKRVIEPVEKVSSTVLLATDYYLPSTYANKRLTCRIYSQCAPQIRDAIKRRAAQLLAIPARRLPRTVLVASEEGYRAGLWAEMGTVYEN